MARRLSSPVLIGRTEELAVLQAAFERVAAGGAELLFIDGDPGIGKTRLTAEFGARVADRAELLVGSCLPLGASEAPYAPWRQALGARPAVATAAGDESASFEAWAGLLRDLAGDRPVVLVLEDLQWADRSSLELLSYLAQSLTVERVLLIGTLRTEALTLDRRLRRLVSELARNQPVGRLTLPPMTDAEVRDLIAAIAGDQANESPVDAVVDRCDGNPLFAEELLALASASDAKGLPRAIEDALLSRIGALDGRERRVASLLAAAGSDLPDELLAGAGHLGPTRYVDALRHLVDRGVVVAVDDGGVGAYRFRHLLLGEAIYRSLLPVERRAAHNDLADAILQQGPADEDWRGGPMELAHHLDLAGREPEALEAALEAARASFSASAYASAYEIYLRVLDLWRRTHPADAPAESRLAAILAEAAQAAYLAGELDEAVSLGRQVIDALDASDYFLAGAARQRLGSYLSAANDDAAALAILEEAIEVMPADPPTPDRIRLLLTLSAAHMLKGRYSRSAEICRMALDGARAIDDHAMEAQALNFLGVDAVNLGNADEGIEHLGAALRLARVHSDGESVLLAYNNLAFCLSRADRLDEADRVAADGVAESERLNLQRRSGTGIRATWAHVLYRLGRWQDAQEIVADGLAMKPLGENATSLLAEAARIHAARGEFEAARSAIDDARAKAPHAERADIQPILAMADVERALWMGDLEGARKTLRGAFEAISGTEEVTFMASLCAMGARVEAERILHARALRTSLDLDDAAATLKEYRRQANQLARRSGEAAATGVRADLLMVGNEVARQASGGAAHRWDEAAVAYESIGTPYPLAYATFRHGEALLQDRSATRDAARSQLNRARTIAAQLGAGPLLSEIDHLAQRARLDIEAERPEPQAAAPFGLTDRELEVLELLRQNRTNRQIAETLFVTEKTAAAHVSNILGKLGVANRRDAAVVADRLQTTGS